jgi:hypothetical protein
LFESPLAALTASLPAETRAAAHARGRQRSLSAAGEEYLQKLRAYPGGLEGLLSQV